MTNDYSHDLSNISNNLAKINNTLDRVTMPNKHKGFIKLHAENEDKIVNITINIDDIDSYAPIEHKGCLAKSRIDFLTKGYYPCSGSSYIEVIETVQDIDKLIRDQAQLKLPESIGLSVDIKGEVVEIPLNTSSILSYINWDKKHSRTRLHLSFGNNKNKWSSHLEVLNSKEYIDSILI